jgi:hypothetical protein
MNCRIIRLSDARPRMNEAFEEAVLPARREGQPIDTVHIWQNSKAVILPSLAASDKIVDTTKSPDILVFRNKGNKFDKRFDGHRKLAIGAWQTSLIL